MKEKKLKKKKGARRHAVCRSQVVPLLRDHFFPVVYYNIPVDFFFLSLSLTAPPRPPPPYSPLIPL